MGRNKGTRLVKLQDFLKQTDVEVIGGLGLGGGIRTLYRPLSILNEKERALKSSDLWIEAAVTKQNLIAQNRLTSKTVEIPLDCLVPSLRRHSGVGYLDITENSDFLVMDAFPHMDEFFDHKKTKEKFEDNVVTWKEYVKRRVGRVLIARKFDLSAPGTCLLSFYSSVPLAPGEFWVIRPLTSEYAKIISLWLNGTPNLTQMFLNRTETRGAWMKIDVRTLKESYIIDPRTLSKNENAELSRTFRQIGDNSFPSILNQLETAHPARELIDRVLLKMIGFSEGEIKETLDYLYSALANEIQKLKTLMAG